MRARNRFGRLAATAAVVLASVAVAVGAGPAGPATAAAACAAPNVRLAVDFRHWSAGFGDNGSAGNLVTACVPFTSGMKGIDLFRQGGFTTTGTLHDGPAFICRINGLPATSDNPGDRSTEDCKSTPPATAYWSYWFAKPGATTWTYSSYGAYSNTVTAGSVEAWTYGQTDVGGTTGQPSFSPQSQLPTAAAVGGSGGGGATSGGGAADGGTSNGSTNGGGTNRGGAAGGTSGGTAGSGPSTTAGPPTPTGGSDATTPSSGSGGATPGASTPGTASGAAGPDAAASPSSVDIDAISNPAGVTRSGTPWATVGTIAALVVVGGVGGGLAWKRKRTSS